MLIALEPITGPASSTTGMTFNGDVGGGTDCNTPLIAFGMQVTPTRTTALGITPLEFEVTVQVAPAGWVGTVIA